jgi:DNA-binding transcriptional regulator YhcF (GntR family)
MAKSYHWIKLWNEVLHDPKMGRLPDNLWRRFIECCLMANELDMGGRLPPVHDIAWKLRIEEETLRGEFEQLARMGLLDYISKKLDEHWIVVNFDKRQERMTSAERMRRKRERDKSRTYYEQSDDTVTNRNTEKRREEEEGEGTAAQEYPPETHWTGPQVEKFVTGISGISANLGIDRMQNVRNAILSFGEEKAKSALSEAFIGWCDTKSEKTGRKYSPHNLGWIDWGIDYLLNGEGRWKAVKFSTTAEKLKAAGYDV